MAESSQKRVENVVGKGEIASYAVFSKDLYRRHVGLFGNGLNDRYTRYAKLFRSEKLVNGQCSSWKGT